MLEFSRCTQTLASDLYQQQLLLESFANLSIFESTADRDQYLSSATQFLLETPIDSANGCVLTNCSANGDSRVIYASTYNAVFACWLLSAGKALCNGELCHYGKIIIEAVDQNMWDAKANGFVKNKNYSVNALPFYIEAETLLESLSEDEVKLLVAYIGSEIIHSSGYVCLHFRYLLKDAAGRAKMSIKQAQIIDESLRNKIKSINQDYYTEEKGEKANKEQQLIILSCMTQALLWYPREIKLRNYQRLKNKALEYLEDSNGNATQVQLYFVLAETMQLESDQELLTMLYQKSALIKWETELAGLSSYSAIQLYKLYCLFVEFGLIDELPNFISDYGPFKELENFSIKRLNQNIQSNENTKLMFFEKYRISQLLI